MAVTYATLFARLGKLFQMAKTIRSQMSALRTEYSDIVNKYTDADMYMIGNLTEQIERRIDDAQRTVRLVRMDSESTLIEMMDDDLVSSNGGGLEHKTVHIALRELIRQMDANSASVNGTTISIATPSAFGTGKGVMVLSSLASQALAPDTVDYPSVRTELIRAKCVRDANDPSVSEGAEMFDVMGQRTEGTLDEEWPKGSGLRALIKSVDPSNDQQASPGFNTLRNSSFEEFVSNTPSGWTIAVGAAGAQVLEDASTPYSGSSALKLTSNGSLAIKLTQSFNSGNGTFGRIKPDTPYTISFAVKRAGSVSAGVLRVYVTDGSAVLNNSDANRKMQIELAFNNANLTTSYKLVTLACMTPKEIPKGSYFVIETSTAFTNGTSVFIDHLSLAEMQRPQPGGVAVQILSGATRFAFDDESISQVTNNNEGEFNLEFSRFFRIGDFGYALPPNYAGGETISDGLIG